MEQRPKRQSLKTVTKKAKTKKQNKNIEVNLCDIGFGNGFLDMTPNACITKEKMANLGFIKIKDFYASKDIIKKVKREPPGWSKYLHIIYLIRVFHPRRCKEILQLNNKKTKSTI